MEKIDEIFLKTAVMDTRGRSTEETGKKAMLEYAQWYLKEHSAPKQELPLSIRVSKILDECLPADAAGTEREKLRMQLHAEICMLINTSR